MAFTVPQQWTGSGGRDDVRIPVQPTAGNWMIVTIAYTADDGTDPLASIADLARNWWVLLGQVRNIQAALRVEVWACPAVDYAAFQLDIVYAAVSHIHANDVGSVVVNVAEVAGFGNNFPTVVSTTVNAATSTSFALTMPNPGGAVLAVGVAATDNAAPAVTAPAGWGALTQVSRTGPDARIAPVWLATSGTATATWTAGSSVRWAGVVVALAATGTVWPQPNANWPATKLQLGRTVGQETPLPRVPWTDETARFEALQAQRGVQYELGRTQAGEATITLRNFDDGLTPQAGGTYDIYTPYQLLMAWNGKVYPVSSGYIEEYPRRWTDPHHGYVDAQGVDAIATLVQDVPTPVQGEVLRHSPYAYWPLTDPSGSTNAVNISGRSSTLLYLQRSKYGGGSGKADFGGDVGIRGDDGSGWQIQGMVHADTSKGYALVGTNPAFPKISGGITILGMALIPTDLNPQPSTPITLVLLRSADSRNPSAIKFAMETGLGMPQVTVWDKDTGAASTTSGTNNMAQGKALPFVLRFNRTSFRADHSLVDTSTMISGSCDLPDTFNAVTFGGEADAFNNGFSGNVTLAHLALYDRWLSDDEVTQYVSFASDGWGGNENAASRIQRFLATAGALTPRALDASTTTVSADATTGTVAERAADYADQDTGLLFGDAAGYLRLRSKSRTYEQSVRWTLGDNTALGEIPFQGDAQPTMGPTYLMNEVAINNAEEQTLGTGPFVVTTYPDVTHTALDVNSMSRYGPRPMERSTHFQYASAPFGLSQWLLAQYKTPRSRFETVTVSAAKNPSAWPLVLGVEVGDLIDVVRRPVGQAEVRVPCRVMQVKHTIAAGKGQTRGEVTLTLAAAFPSVLVLGHPTKAVLGNNTIGWA